MINWEDFKYQLVQIDFSKKKRESGWIAVCKSCQCERTITYSQAWNIAKGKVLGNCHTCKPMNDSNHFKSGQSPWNKGINYNPERSYEKNKKQMEIVNTFGQIFSDECKNKQRIAKLGIFGEKTNGWKGGKTPERITLMARDDYKQLRKDCFFRDNYTCQTCLVRGGKLEMDHIKEWCNYPELRYEISNVRTLCKDCHKNTDNYSYKARRKRAS
jgi:5-methylcytosine-specific restriction protein A